MDNKFLTIPPKGYAHLADHDEVSPTVEKRNVYASYKSNPKVQAFVDGIINSEPKSAVTQNVDELPTVADDVFQTHDKRQRENKVPPQTPGVVDDIINSLQSSSNSEDDKDVSATRDTLPQKRKLPSPTPSLIDDVLEGFQKKSKIDDNGDDDSSTSVSSEDTYDDDDSE